MGRVAGRSSLKEAHKFENSLSTNYPQLMCISADLSLYSHLCRI